MKKKWNLDVPDGFRGYWHDTRRELLRFTKQNFGGGNVMVWRAFSANGCPFTASRYISNEKKRLQAGPRKQPGAIFR